MTISDKAQLKKCWYCRKLRVRKHLVFVSVAVRLDPVRTERLLECKVKCERPFGSDGIIIFDYRPESDHPKPGTINRLL